jgi:hypothetical protein
MSTIRLILALLLVGLTGCNAFIGHHGNSLKKSGYREELQLCIRTGPEELKCADDLAALQEIAFVPAAAVAAAIPIALNLVRKGIEAESKQYKATYSSREAAILYQCMDEQTREPRIDAIRFVRVDSEGKELVRLDIGIEQEGAAGAALRLVPLDFKIAGTKSKVAWAGWWPTQWLTNLVWGPWYLADSDIAKVDFNAQVTMEAIATQEQNRLLVSLGSVDFPLGKYKINELSKASAPNLGSGWIPLPVMECAAGRVLPVNFMLTFMEANDLGDVLAKGAEKFKENEDEIAQKLIEKLGAGQ